MLGYTDGSLLGVNVVDLVHPEDLSKIPSQLPALQAGETIFLELRLRKSSGVYLSLA